MKRKLYLNKNNFLNLKYLNLSRTSRLSSKFEKEKFHYLNQKNIYIKHYLSKAFTYINNYLLETNHKKEYKIFRFIEINNYFCQ